MLEAEITPAGDVLVEGQHVGRLDGFRFAPDADAEGPDVKALRAAAAEGARRRDRRACREASRRRRTAISCSPPTARSAGRAAAIARHRRRRRSAQAAPHPARRRGAGRAARASASRRGSISGSRTTSRRCSSRCSTCAAPRSLHAAARGIAFRLVENLGVVDRTEIAEEVRRLDQESRAGMRALGVRFGAHHIYVPALLKPAPGGAARRTVVGEARRHRATACAS